MLCELSECADNVWLMLCDVMAPATENEKTNTANTPPPRDGVPQLRNKISFKPQEEVQLFTSELVGKDPS